MSGTILATAERKEKREEKVGKGREGTKREEWGEERRGEREGGWEEGRKEDKFLFFRL